MQVDLRGGLSADGSEWIPSRRRFFLSVRVLSRLFRHRFLKRLADIHANGRLKFFGDYTYLADAKAFGVFLKPLCRTEWVVYAKEPFAGPTAVLAYLSRYTHRVAISNSRLIKTDGSGVTFRYKDYRLEGPQRQKTMTLSTHEFIRRFMMHVLPKGFHRIRHYGLFASGRRAENIERARELLCVSAPPEEAGETRSAQSEKSYALDRTCPACGGPMTIVEVFARGCAPQYQPGPEGLDSS